MKQTVALIFALFVIAGCSRKIDLASELHSLVETEREFAKRSIEKGHRQAFLDYFAEDAVLFRPYPVSARAYLLEQPADESRLTWEPIYADISRAGDLGYTYGTALLAGDSTAPGGIRIPPFGDEELRKIRS